MILKAALLALLLQAPAAPKATVSGVVVNANGEPVPNIKVTLGKLGVNLGAFTQMVMGDRPTREQTVPAAALAMIAEEIAAEIASGAVPPEEARQMKAIQSVSFDDIYELTVTAAGSMSVVYKSMPPVQTDDRGRFTFSGVDAGTYRLSFSGTGYGKVDFGQRASGLPGVPLTLTPGQSKSDIAVRMVAVGAISGRIRDNTGQPAVGVPVQLLRFTYDDAGKRSPQKVASTRTNDLGEYRMYYLTPGRYYISAGTPSGTSANLPDNILFGGYNTDNRIQQRYALTYFPGVANEADAGVVEVPSGADLRGVDLFVAPTQTYKIRGRVVDSKTGQPPQTVNLSLTPQVRDLSGPISTGVGNPNYKAADGSFELQNVSAGAWVLSASIASPIRSAPIDFNSMSPEERNAYFRDQDAQELLRPKASLPLNVVNADLNGVVLSMGLNGSMTGRLRVEFAGGNTPPNLDFTRVQLKSLAPTSIMESGPQVRSIAADGTFKIDNVRAGDYRIAVQGMPEGFYLKEVRLNDTDVLDGPLHYVSGETPVLEVVLAAGVGSIDGTTEPGSQVVLIPTRNRERTELFRPVTADSTGKFSIPNVAPGDYTLASWETMEPFAFFDPNVIWQAEGQGKAVRVAEGTSQTVSVTSIK